MKKRNISLFTMLIILLAFSTKAYSGIYSGGNGTAENPYQIATTADLGELCNTNGDWGAYFIQTADLDLFSDGQSGGIFYNGGEGFSPIGTSSNRFTGSYDGNGKTISYLWINRCSTSGIGLFGHVDGGTISKLGIYGADIEGYSEVGAIAGATYNGAIIDQCFSQGAIRANGGYTFAGGLVGYSNNSFIYNSYSGCSVTGAGYIGGVCGHATGELFGGQGLTNTYSYGVIDAGGVLGSAGMARVANCFYNEETSGSGTSSVYGTARTTAELKVVATFTDLSNGLLYEPVWDFVSNPYDDAGNDDYWAIDPEINDGYPYLNWHTFVDFPAGQGTDLGDGTTVNPTIDLDYAADQTIPEIPNGSFTADHEFVLAGAGVIDITITTSSTYGAYHQSGMWHSEQNSGGAITFTGVDFDAKGDVPIILGDDNPLPVVLSTFTAIQTQTNFAQLNWITQSETNNAFWNIYRAEKDDFTLAKTVNPAPVEGQGNSTTETNYTFTDETVSSINATYWYWLESVSLSGESNICASLSIEMSEPDNPTPPVNIITGLHQNYPNPFNPNTKIQFAVEETTKAKLSIFNQKGQKIITLFDDIAQPEQYYNLDWNGQDSKGKSVASGLYFYKLETDSNDTIKKMLLIK